jgi:hypothetical protein
MLRKMMLALVAIAFMGALAAPTAANARWSGRGVAGRPSVGPQRFEFRPGFNRFGFRRVGFVRKLFIRPRRFAFHPDLARNNRSGFRRFGVAVTPFAVGAGVYEGPCWGWQPTPLGWQPVWLCGGGYDCGYGDF